MGKRNKNTFSKALGHLKSKKIDEKLQMLSERPANSTLGYMTAVGSQSNPDFVSTQQGQESAQNKVIPDFDVGAYPTNSTEAQDTTGLFEEDGTLRVASPPGDNSYILGPMAAMWYAWANSTRIGYIRQSDRRMVNLGGLTGKLSDWDGQMHPSGSGPFYSYGQLTLEQVQWFRTIQKQPGATNDPDTYNYRAFYPGPPSNTPDAFGRYYCVVTGEPKQGDELPGVGEPEVNPGEGGPQDPDSIFSAIMDRIRAGEKLSKAEKEFLKSRLPDPRSIKGNRMMKEALVMPPDLFKEKYGLDPEEVNEYYRNVHGTEVTATPPPPASTRGLDARAIELGYNDPSYPVNPDGYYNQQLTNAEEILQSLMDAEFYGSLARGDSPNYSNAEISKAKADLEKAKKERENWEKWKDDNDYQWQGDIQTTAGTPESLQQQKQEVEEVRQSLETGEGINWDKVWMMIDAGLLAWDAVSMAGVMFPELGSSILGGLGLGVGRILRGARNLIKGASTVRKVTSTSRPPKPTKPLPDGFKYTWNPGDSATGGKGQWTVTGNFKNTTTKPNRPPKPDKKLPKDMEYNWNPKGGSDGKGQWEVRGTDNFWNTGGSGGPKTPKGGPKTPKGGGDGPTPKFTDPTTGRPLDSVDPSSIRRPDGKPFDPLPPQSNTGKPPKVPNTDADTQYSPNIFTRGKTQRNDPWIDRGASSEKTAKTISDLVKDNITGVDRQRTSTAPDAAWNPLRGMPGYGTLKGKVNPRINKINQARAKRGKGPLSADQINPGGFQTGPDEASRRLFKGVGNIAGNVGKSNVSKNVSQRQGKKVNRRGRSIKESFLLEEIQSTDDAQQYMVDRLLKFIKDPKFIKNLDKIISKLDSYEKKSKKKNVKESYSRRVLSESRKANIIRDLKKPVVIPETKQKSYKVKPKIKTLKTVISKPVATPEEYKPPMKMWGRYEYNHNVRESQERMNQVMNLIGEGEQAMEYRLKNGTTRSEQEMKEFWGKHPELYDFYFNNMNHRMLRKEQVEGGEFVVFLVAENGLKVSMSQSKLNEKLAEAEDQKLLDEYAKSNPKSEPISYEKDPLFKKVSSKLRPVINYPKKPSPKGYPDKAPPKLVNGFHPDLGKRYKYDKLDPQSAEAMPPQGNPEIDANIEKFTDKNAKIRKIKNLIGKKS